MSAAVAPRTPFFMVANAIVDDYQLNPYEMTLYNAILRHVNYATGTAWPSLNRLMALTRLARPTVVKYIRRLEDKGLIRVTRGYKKGSTERAVNQYEVLAPSPYRDDAAAGDRGARHEAPPAPPERPGLPRELPPVNAVNYPGKRDLPPVVNATNRNETALNKTIQDEMSPNDRGPARSAGSRLPDGSAAPRPVTLTQEKKLSHSESWGLFCRTLGDICALDFEANQGRIRKTASPLWRKGDGYEPEDLRAFARWWAKNDWRGRKGEAPRLRDVTENIRVAVEGMGLRAETSDEIRLRYTRGEYADIISY